MHQFINITKYNRLLYSYQWKGPLKFTENGLFRISIPHCHSSFEIMGGG
jgi:hypothetical protein